MFISKVYGQWKHYVLNLQSKIPAEKFMLPFLFGLEEINLLGISSSKTKLRDIVLSYVSQHFVSSCFTFFFSRNMAPEDQENAYQLKAMMMPQVYSQSKTLQAELMLYNRLEYCENLIILLPLQTSDSV